uniref:Putative LOC100642437 [Bombus terrestris] n=1 Tax=Lepeophtheirus salmonis TaxID=72036 RepID=A0A0K2UJS5_LEPSM
MGDTGYQTGMTDGNSYTNYPQQPNQQQYEAYNQSNYVQQQSQQHVVVGGNYQSNQQHSPQQQAIIHQPQPQQFIQHIPQRDFRSPQQQHMPRQFQTQIQHDNNPQRYRHPLNNTNAVRSLKGSNDVGYQPKPQQQQHRPILLNSQGGHRLVKIPQGNIRLIVQPRQPQNPNNQRGGSIYLKPGGPASVELNNSPRQIRMQQPQHCSNIRMVMESQGPGPRAYRPPSGENINNHSTNRMHSPRSPQLMNNHHPSPHTSTSSQQNNWSNNTNPINVSAAQTGYTASGPQQQQRPPQFVQSPPQNEIAYDVEHIFMENGREVKKMPIKFGDKTIWVDCVPGAATENRDDQVVFDLLESDQSLTNSSGGVGQQQCIPKKPPPPPPMLSNATPSSPQEMNTKMTGTKEDREKIVHAVLHDLISPAELSSRHGVSVNKIRDWVKATGNKLPSKYRVKNEKIKNNTIPSSPPNQQMAPQQQLNAAISTTTSQPTYRNNNSAGMEMNNETASGVVHSPAHFQNPHLIQASQVQMHNEPLPQKLAFEHKPQVEGQPPTENHNNISTQIIVSKPSSLNIEPYKPKLVHGKLALCKNCGSTSPDFNKCIRCKKPLPDSCKVIDDPNAEKQAIVGIHTSSTTSTAVTVEFTTKSDLRGIRIHPKQRKKTISEEPVCIALSSDEEGGDEEGEEDKNDSTDQQRTTSQDDKKEEEEEGAGGTKNKEEEESVVDDPIVGDYITLTCRSVRIGSYKSVPRDKVIFTQKGLRIVVPSIKDPSVAITLDIKKKDFMQFDAHFGRGMPIFFLFISVQACRKIRDLLKMESSHTQWLDVASQDETQKRITILPDKMNDDAKHILLRNFGNELLTELGPKEANDILVRSSPKDNIVFRMATHLPQNKPPGLPQPSQSPSIKYCTFPPSSHDSVTVSTEDYCVLEDESFLNDVIIDFYCRYLQYKVFSEFDRQRTHIFSTFFYNRLTSRPKKQKNKLHPVEDNPNLSAAEKRYERVKRWTKKVNLFDKDFIIIPINEHSHWFVAIICYPGQIGCRRIDNDESVDSQVLIKNPNRKSILKTQKRLVQIGSTTIIPLKPGDHDKVPVEEELSDRDEADASDDDMMDEEPNRINPICPSQNNKEPPFVKDPLESDLGPDTQENSTEEQPRKSLVEESGNDEKENQNITPQNSENITDKDESSPKERVPIKQPCILIFDSLATGSRARVAATLRDYLMCEHKAKMGHLREFTKESMMGHCPKVPQQPNFSDCGIFLLQYVESFFHSPIADYHLPIMNLRNWFSTDIVRNKRSDIAKIIRNLAEEQNPGKNITFPGINFTPSAGSGYTDDEMEDEMEEEFEDEEEEDYYDDDDMLANGSSELGGEESSKTNNEEDTFVAPQGYFLSKSSCPTTENGGIPSVKIIPTLPGVQINRIQTLANPQISIKNSNSASASPDSTSAKEEECKSSSQPLVEYSDSGSDETPPVPDSSQQCESGVKRPHSNNLQDYVSEEEEDEDDGSKKAKFAPNSSI